MSSYNCLYDPYEFFGMYIRKEELLEKGMSIQDIDSIISLMQSVFVASFSGNLANNLPMWAHYANNHKGLCLKYKVNNKMTIRNVIYESKPIDITKIFIKFIEYRDTI